MQSYKIKYSDILLLAAVFLMMTGFLYSRAMLSMGMIVLFLNALHPKEWKQNFQIFKKNRFVIFCFLFFCAFFLSGLWSDDKVAWWRDTQIKLPFLILPIAMLSSHLQMKRQSKNIIFIVLFVLAIGMMYSLYQLIRYPEPFLKGAHFTGPLKNDYLRFSLALVLGINLVFYFFRTPKSLLSTRNQIWLISWLILAVVYLHLQASKLGLLALYSLSIIFLVYFLFQYIAHRKVLLPLLFLLGLIGLISIASLQLPTIQQQISGAQKEKQAIQTQNEEYKGSSIKPRLISYQAAWNIIKTKPMFGVGSGDCNEEMYKEYQKNFPEVNYFLIPHSQFIFTMMAVGIPLSIIFMLMVLIPVSQKPDIFEFATFVVMLWGLLVEAMLQIQNGVFVYLFFSLFWMAIKVKPIKSKVFFKI